MDDRAIKKIKENMTKGLVQQNYTEWMMVRGDEGGGKTCRGCDEPITVRDSSLSYLLATSGKRHWFHDECDKARARIIRREPEDR